MNMNEMPKPEASSSFENVNTFIRQIKEIKNVLDSEPEQDEFQELRERIIEDISSLEEELEDRLSVFRGIKGVDEEANSYLEALITAFEDQMKDKKDEYLRARRLYEVDIPEQLLDITRKCRDELKNLSN